MKIKQFTKPILFTSLFLFIFMMSGWSQVGSETKPSPPATATGKISDANITINYSSPGVKDRIIWGQLVPFDKVWRAGANEATTFETDKDIMVEDKVLPAGKYSLFVIPKENDSWIAVFNSEAKQWGAYKYDETKDVIRVFVSPQNSEKMYERLTYEISPNKTTMYWANLALPISMK